MTRDRHDQRIRHAVIVDGKQILTTDHLTPPRGWSWSIARTVPRGEGIHALAISPESGTVGPSTLDALPDLQILHATSVGTDHLDEVAEAARGVITSNTPAYCTAEVADHALALVLASVRHLPILDREIRRGQWALPTRPPSLLADTTLGLWGFGPIAQALAHRAIALKMKVLVHTRRPIDDHSVRQVSWEELLCSSNVLSLHVPLISATRGRLDRDALSRMPARAHLVNVARGELIDEVAVARALRDGDLASAALDVLSTEPPPADHPLLSAPNVLLTPHAAWLSDRSIHRPVQRFADVLAASIRAGSPV